MKTRKSVLKRFKFTKNGKVLRRHTGLAHLRSKMTGNAKRKGRKWVELSPSEVKIIKKALKLG
jgi:ribosomal protein L35